MNIGIVTPISLLKLSKLGSLKVAYSILCKDRDYLNFFRNKSNIVLDYSPVVPRKDYISLDIFTKTIEILNPEYIVVPSVDFSTTKTIDLAERLSSVVGSRGIGILQGTTLDQLSKCYTRFVDLFGVVGLPSTLEVVARRYEIIRDLDIKMSTIYLEVYNNPLEEIPSEANTLGIITSFPIRLALESRNLDDFIPTPKKLDFHYDVSSVNIELAESNIKRYIEVVNSE